MRWSAWLVLLLLGCSETPPKDAAPAPGSLKEIPVTQLRMMLKGYAGDWRGDTAQARGEAAPDTEYAVPDGAAVTVLPSIEPRRISAGLGTVLQERRSQREFSDDALSLEDLSVLLWAAQGVTDADAGLRTAPSGGGRFPLNTWVVARRVEGLAPGLYGYLPASHAVWQVRELDDPGQTMAEICYGQAFVGTAACTFVWSAVPERTEWKYGYISHRMIAMEAGHVGQNVYLACQALGWGTCTMLGYNQIALDCFLEVDGETEFGMYLAPVGRPVVVP